MPLHYKMLLCEFSYIGVEPSSSATFEYDTEVNINKTTQKLFYKNNETEIDKTDTKMICKEVTNINKNIDKFLYRELFHMFKNKEYKLRNFKINELTKNSTANLSVDKNFELTKNNTFQFSGNNLEFIKTKEFILDKFKKYKGISIEDKIIELNITVAPEMNKSIFYDLIKGLKELDQSIKSKIFNKNNMSQLYLKENNRYLNRYNTKNIDKYIGKTLRYTHQVKQIYKENILFVDRTNKELIDKNNIIFRQMYKDYKNIFKNNPSRLMYKNTVKNIFIDRQHLLDRDNTKFIIKGNVNRLMYKNGSKKISKNIENYLEKIAATDIYKNETLSLKKDVITNILKWRLQALNKPSINIYNPYILKGLNKPNINIYNPYKLKGLNKFARDIYLPYHTKFIEVIKRWWVIEATAPEDLKILPYDYGYANNPLSINRKDRALGSMANQSNHPISFMPYLADNKGIDLNYGIDEINLSIEIMLEMVNIVGMIVIRSASQFANCSGQEAIEFIMELLLDWFNMDTTAQEMTLKGSREHYLRCYRWIRWEAEKVWFKADKDHTQDRMMGIKYAGMLFANLIDYMKYHHFNLVPMWRNLKSMDIERNFNRKANNGDLIKNLDKLKGKRHYFIETKNKI